MIGDTRAAREPAKVDCSATEHTIVKLFEKKKVCCECSLIKAPGERRGVKLVREQIDKLKLNSDHIVNMDEVPLMFDIPMNRTVDVQGPEVLPPDMKNVNSPWYLPVQPGAKNYHPTRGKKLPPMVIFKRKTAVKAKLSSGVIVQQNEKGWMEHDNMVLWLSTCYYKRPGGFFHQSKSLLVLDSMCAHISDITKERIKA